MNPVEKDDKIYLAVQSGNVWTVQVKYPRQRPMPSKYTLDGQKTLEAKNLTRAQAERYLDIVAGKSAPLQPKFQVRDA